MAAYLVRHAKAGDRDEWEGDDRLRPLTKSGHKQAEGIKEQLQDIPIRRIVSSPYLRCVQTVEPLARARGLPIDLNDGLAEGAGIEPTLALVRQLRGQDAVLCTHGDVMQEMVEHLLREGAIKPSQAQSLEKGSTWVLEAEGGKVVRARHLPAP